MRPIPSPKGFPFLGTIPSIIAAGGASKLHLYVDKRHKELGPIYREKIGPLSGIFVSSGNYMRQIFAAEGKYPTHIIPEAWLFYNEKYGCKRGLLFMDGEEWLKFRKVMNTLMLKPNVEEFWIGANYIADILVKEWCQETRLVDLEEKLYKWSLEVIMVILLGCDKFAANKNALSPLITRLATSVHQIFVESAKLSLMPVKVAYKLNLSVWKRFVQSASSAVSEGKRMVENILEIENNCPGEGNLISSMLQTKMEPEDLKRIVVDLILAAGDTTAYTTQWLLHVLSLDRQRQNLIYNEVKDIPDVDVHQCALLKGALKEALRLYPVAPFITRYMEEDYILDGYLIKAKELVLMSLYSSGRNHDYFPEPNSFLPERWLRDGKNYQGVKNPYASLPFAMGSRSCIGKKIAEAQILVTVAKILKNFVIKTDNEKRIDITLHLISVPAEKVSLILEPRKT